VLLETEKHLLYEIVCFLKPKFTLLNTVKLVFVQNKSFLFETRLSAVVIFLKPKIAIQCVFQNQNLPF
jgi:hypothetical protein